MGFVKDLVSIVVPVYNAERFLEQTLDSLRAQSYRDIEVILVDDGSEDSSRAICEGYVARDERFFYYYQENAGAGAARNNGIKLARGEYLMFLDSDDLFEPEFVERMHRAIANGGADAAICRADMFNSVYKPGEAHLCYGHASLKFGVYDPAGIGGNFFQVMTTCPWDKIFRAEHIADKRLCFQNLRYSNDTYFVLMALLTASRIAVTEDVLVHYRYGLGGSLRDKMYLSPYCDLDMLEALRSGFAVTEMARNEELKRSLDIFSANTIVMSCMNLASQSASACNAFSVRMRTVEVPKPKDLMRKPFNVKALKCASVYWAVTSATPEGISWAVSPLGNNGWRGADSSQKHAVWLRVLFSPIALAWKRMRGNATN